MIGNNVYNTTGSFQTKSGSAAPGNTITFGISIQNDGWASDSFRLIGTGTTNTAYTVRYLRGTTDITAAVVAGTYVTPVLGPGAKYLIKAKVTVMATAASGSSITHLVTISSVNDGTAQDAVQLTAKRR